MKLSVDDACSSDVRVAELALKYEIETIFYWPVEWRSLAYDNGYEPLHYVDALRIANDFEVGSHTITHRHLTTLSEMEALIEIADSQMILSRMFKQAVRRFCPPRGYTNKMLTDYTLKLYDSQRLTKGKELVHIHPNSGANGNKPWRECITEDTEEIWGHSHEFNRFNLWDELEEFLRERSSA